MRKTQLLGICLAFMLGACSAPDEPTITLFLAVQRGDIDQVERHIHWQSDINKAFPNGRFAIHEAADKGRLILLRLLMKNGADLEAKDSQGLSALDVAILNGRTQAADMLLAANAQLDASALLLKATEQGVTDRDSVRYLAAKGADLEAKNPAGDTPLLLAIRKGNHRLAHHLVDQGANVNAATAKGKTALQLATSANASELIQLLRRNGAVLTATPSK